MLKGLWRLTENREEAQDFIYKKTWGTSSANEESEEALLKQYYYDEDINLEMIDSSIGQEHKNLMEINNHKLMLTKLFHS